MTSACQLLLAIFTKLASSMTWVEGQHCIFFLLVNIVQYLPICALCRYVDFGTPSFHFTLNIMYYSYVEVEYIATSFSPARTDLALKLLSNILNWTSTCGSARYKRYIQNRTIQSKRVLGLIKYTHWLADHNKVTQ